MHHTKVWVYVVKKASVLLNIDWRKKMQFFSMYAQSKHIVALNVLQSWPTIHKARVTKVLHSCTQVDYPFNQQWSQKTLIEQSLLVKKSSQGYLCGRVNHHNIQVAIIMQECAKIVKCSIQDSHINAWLSDCCMCVVLSPNPWQGNTCINSNTTVRLLQVYGKL